MNKVKESILENKEQILASLPVELHADFETNLMNSLPDESDSELSEEEEIKAIKAELVANPAVDENLAKDELKNISASVKPVEISQEDHEKEKASLLKEAKAMAAKTAANHDSNE